MVEYYQDEDRPIGLEIRGETLRVELADGRVVVTHLSLYPSLLRATQDQLRDFEFSSSGVHWPELDEDLSVEGMLRVGTVEETPAGSASIWSDRLVTEDMIAKCLVNMCVVFATSGRDTKGFFKLWFAHRYKSEPNFVFHDERLTTTPEKVLA